VLQLKFIVIGPYHSGKTSFIRIATRGQSISINRSGTTISYDFGRSYFLDIRVDIYGTPGEERFGFMREIVSIGADGVFLIIDSTDKSKDKDVYELWKLYNKILKEVPLLVLANKQDLPNARCAEDLIEDMKFLAETPIIETSMVTGYGVFKALNMMVYLALANLYPVLIFLKKTRTFRAASILSGLSTSDIAKIARYLEIRGLINVRWSEKKIMIPQNVVEVLQGIKYIKDRSMSLKDMLKKANKVKEFVKRAGFY